MIHKQRLLTAVAVVALVMACGWSPPASPASVTGGTGNLNEAMGVTPARTTFVTYMDWAGIKAAYGGSALSGASPPETKRAFLRDNALGTLRGSTFVGDATLAQWGFDAFDLEWEVREEIPSAWILRFPDDFDLDPIIKRFDVRGFGSEKVGDGVLRTHEATPASWMFDVSFANAGILGDHILVFASAPETVRDVLDRGRLLADTAPAAAAVRALDEPLEAAFMTGPGMCSSIIERYRAGIAAEPARAFLDRLTDASKEQVALAERLRPYDMLAIGDRAGVHPTGRIVMSFADASVAADELGPRRALATEGVSWLFSRGLVRASSSGVVRRYSEEAFTVTRAEAIDTNIVLAVSPPPSGGSRLLSLVWQQDLLFAGCG